MRLWAFVLATVSFAGCATTQAGGAATPTRVAEDYYPLAVGNRWTYEAEMLGQKSTQTIEIVAQEGPFFVDNTGQKLTVDAYGLRDEKRYLLQEPITQDHAWKNTVSVSATERYRIDSVGATCETPAGTFDDCVIVTSTLRRDENTQLANEITFARGVGIVRIAVDLIRSGTRTPQHRIALVGYQLEGRAQ